MAEVEAKETDKEDTCRTAVRVLAGLMMDRPKTRVFIVDGDTLRAANDRDRFLSAPEAVQTANLSAARAIYEQNLKNKPDESDTWRLVCFFKIDPDVSRQAEACGEHRCFWAKLSSSFSPNKWYKLAKTYEIVV